MGATFSQFFPPAPTVTEQNLASQYGKVFIVTGGASGVGLELCAILYQAGGRVYMAGRSQSNAEAAITNIKSRSSSTTTQAGELAFLNLHLEDLSSTKATVQDFLSRESRLDVLFNNAGVSNPPRDILSAQGHEMTMATNCLGHHLLTQLLLPTLKHTASTLQPSSTTQPRRHAVRVVYTSSIAVDLGAPSGGMVASQISEPPSNLQLRYTNSKTGNVFLAAELARQLGPESSVLSVVQNPGNLYTPLLRHMPRWVGWLAGPLLYEPKMGAYTELYSGLGNLGSVGEDGWVCIVPWGRRHPAFRHDLLMACRTKEQGGTGTSQMFVEWCDKQIERFL